ncbi:phosphoribosylaminoimidazolesuccinocarboxamide synthase [Pseudomonas aeruginosa]|nr:phosphoribosylaminoimidazolesuccinocarboxamide synthase [Pseudomonas aeruginosa]
MEKREELYRGKAKSVYQTDDADRLILLFRNDTSAFDGKRIEQLDRKGAVNNKFNAFIMQKAGSCRHSDPVRQAAVGYRVPGEEAQHDPGRVRGANFAAGSLVRRLGVEEGIALTPPTFELFLKNDARRSVHQRIPRPGLRLGHSRAAGADEDLFLQGQ